MKIFYFIFFFFIGILKADDDNFFYSVSCAASLSHSGYAIIPSTALNWQCHTLYLGVKLPVNNIYTSGDQSYGINLGFTYNIIQNYQKKNISSFVVLDYQLISYEQKTRFADKGHNNLIHELNIGYGILLRIYDNIYVGNTIAVGKYWESYYNNYSHSRIIFDGYDNNIKLFLTYYFNED